MTATACAEHAALATIADEVAPRLKRAVIIATTAPSGQNRKMTIDAQINAIQVILSEVQRMLIVADLQTQGKEVRK